MANALNNHFSTVGENIAKNVANEEICPVKSEIYQYTEPFLEVSEEDVMMVICGLRGGSSPGIDRFNVELFKKFKEFLAPPLRFIANYSFRENIFPSDYKKALLIPIFKKGDPEDMSN